MREQGGTKSQMNITRLRKHSTAEHSRAQQSTAEHSKAQQRTAKISRAQQTLTKPRRTQKHTKIAWIDLYPLLSSKPWSKINWSVPLISSIDLYPWFAVQKKQSLRKGKSRVQIRAHCSKQGYRSIWSYLILDQAFEDKAGYRSIELTWS